MKATIKDIAQAAGVSPSTVSRVLSNHPRISAETAQRVRAIMREMRYQPNQLARSLVSRKRTIIAVVLPSTAETSLSDPFFYDVLRGISVGASQEEYHVLLSTGAAPKAEGAKLEELMHSGIVGGAILLTSKVQDATVQALLEDRFPFVVLGHPDQDTQIHWVDNDNIAAGCAVTEHVLARGRRRVAFIGLDAHYRVTADRCAGYHLAHERAGLSPARAHVLEMPYASTRVSPERLRALFSGKDRPDAAVCTNDLIALEMMRDLAALGLRVPEDVAVVGFNNLQAGRYSAPPLTTVEIDAEGLGRSAFRLLLGAMEHPKGGAARQLIPFQLIERGSVG